jgi:hypothetical protein
MGAKVTRGCRSAHRYDRSRPMVDPATHRLVFVGGVHRSGTTLLGRCLAEHPEVSGFAETGVPADEGQHLQTVYPTARTYGGPGKFGFAEAAHLTEASSLATEENARRLLADWEPYWDVDRSVLVEKSPPNLIRFRFLQALYPEAFLVAVTRHPAAVSLATQKWSKTSVRSLLEHWVTCHRTFAADRPLLARVHVVRYEDLVARPQAVLDGVYGFLGLESHPVSVDIRPDGNASYFAQWAALGRGSLGRARVRRLERRFETDVEPFGYSLVALPTA